MEYILILTVSLGLALPAFGQGVIFAGEEDLKAFDQMVKKSRRKKQAIKKSKIKKQMQALTDSEVRSVNQRDKSGKDKNVRTAGKKAPNNNSGIASEINPPKGKDRSNLDKNPGGKKNQIWEIIKKRRKKNKENGDD